MGMRVVAAVEAGDQVSVNGVATEVADARPVGVRETEVTFVGGEVRVFDSRQEVWVA